MSGYVGYVAPPGTKNRAPQKRTSRSKIWNMAMLWTALVTVSLPSAVALTSTATCQHATGECYNNPGKAHHISTTLSNRSACACAAKCVGAARCVSWTNWQPTTPQCGNTGAEFCCRLYSSNGTLVTCPGAGAKSASGWFGTPPPPAPPPVPPPKGAPNILFIAVDDLRPQLGAYGHRDTITPNMDMLASRGLLFLNAHAQIAHCSPSRNSLLSGRAPDRVKVWNFIDDFREAGDGVGGPSIVSLPQYFKQHGYRTSGTGKIFVRAAPDFAARAARAARADASPEAPGKAGQQRHGVQLVGPLRQQPERHLPQLLQCGARNILQKRVARAVVGTEQLPLRKAVPALQVRAPEQLRLLLERRRLRLRRRCCRQLYSVAAGAAGGRRQSCLQREAVLRRGRDPQTACTCSPP